MPQLVPSFAGALAQLAADAVETALRSLPSDKQTWRPLDKARSAVDLVAECAVTNRYCAELIESAREAWRSDIGTFDQTQRLRSSISAIPNDLQTWLSQKSEIDETSDTAIAALQGSTQNLTSAIKSVPLDALDAQIELPFGTWSLSQIIWHPLWNMTYHEGQINYISTLIEGTPIPERSR